MSGAEDNTPSTKPRISKLAIASITLGILGIFVFCLRILFYRPWWSEFVARNVVGLFGMVGLILGFLALVRISKRIATITLLILICPLLLYLCSHLILFLARSSAAFRFLLGCYFYLTIICLVCVLALPVTRKWKSRLKDKFKEGTFANSGMVTGTLLAIFWFMETCGPVSTALAMSCSYNLSQLGKAMLTYSNDNQGRYPKSDHWCDLLLKNNRVELKHFLCPGVTFRWCRQVLPWPVPKSQRCYYAMNPNCEPNSPADTVLLFETKGGWNNFGGPELMTTENHRRRCAVLFNDGRVDLVKIEQLEELKWGIE